MKNTIHALALKDDAVVAWLRSIGMTEFAGLAISSYGGYIMKIRLLEIDHLELSSCKTNYAS